MIFYDRELRSKVISPLIPVVLYFGLAVGSGMNIGLRHLLSIYPFLFVLAGGAWLLVSVVVFSPNYLTFLNEIIGDPRNGHKALLDSNLDWGQDLKGLTRWQDIHGAQKIQFVYFGIYSAAVPRYYGTDALFLPGTWVAANDLVPSNQALPNYLAISVNHRRNKEIPKNQPNINERRLGLKKMARVLHPLFPRF